MSREIAVVGAGFAGLGTAYELAKRGHQPLLIERFEVGHTRGSSHGDSRIVRLAHDNVADVREAAEALRRWRSWERELDAVLLAQVGGLDLGANTPAIHRALTACDLPAEVLSAGEIRRRFPAIDPAGHDGVYQPDGCVGLAARTRSALSAAYLARGGRILEHTAVRAVDEGPRGVAVRTEAGDELHVDAVVLATGAWIGDLAPVPPESLAVAPTLQTPVHFRLPGASFATIPTVLESAPGGRDFYLMPQPGGDEVKGGVHNAGDPVDLDGHRDPDQRLAEEFEHWAARRFPGLGEKLDSYGCIYTWRPDDRFYLRRHGRVVVVSACSGRGYKFTPLIAERAALLALEPLA